MGCHWSACYYVLGPIDHAPTKDEETRVGSQIAGNIDTTSYWAAGKTASKVRARSPRSPTRGVPRLRCSQRRFDTRIRFIPARLAHRQFALLLLYPHRLPDA